MKWNRARAERISALFVPIFILSIGLSVATSVPPAEAGTHSNARWFVNVVTRNWTCDPFKVGLWGDCYAEVDVGGEPVPCLRCYGFSTTYPGQGVSGSKILFLINEWAAVQGPGSETLGDTPMLWDAPATYDGARGASGLRYLGDLSPSTGGHWGGFSLVKRAEDGTWFGFLEYRPRAESSYQPSTCDEQPATNPEDFNFIYMQRGNPYQWRGGWNGKPGPTIDQFFPDRGGSAAEVFCYDFTTVSSTGLVLLDDENGTALSGYFTWNRRPPNYSSNYTPIEIDPDAETFRLKDAVTGWSAPYSFGTEFPADINPFPNGPNIGWGLFRQHGTGQEYAIRPRAVAGQASTSNPPPGCADVGIFGQNLAQVPPSGQQPRDCCLETVDIAAVSTAQGTVGPWSFWGGGNGWVPGHYNQSVVGVTGGSWSFGTFSYQNTGDLAVCREVLMHWNPNSGGGILVHDYSP